MDKIPWLYNNTCFLTIAGSQAYGMATENSDLDIKGFTLPPLGIREHLFNKFDQAINNSEIEERFSYLKNLKNPKLESTIYSLSKFVQLAANCNPNVLELLWVDSSDILKINKVGEYLLSNRDLFLSSKTKYSYGGYSWAQFYKIERHRKWLIKGEITRPERKDYGLQGESLTGYSEIQRLVKRDIENWNLSKFGFDDLERNKLKDTIFDAVFRLSTNKITWDNWPEKFEEAALTKFLQDFNISEQITNLILRETKYKNDLREYENWLHWKEKRNLDRMNLEKNFGYDCKHGSHLVRLMKTAEEILSGKGIKTKRPDAEWLLEIRNGKWTYEELKEWFDKQNNKLDELYKITKLPKSVNYEKINDLYQNCLELDI
jgi:predicted nucleotidyltransferase